MGSYIMSDNVLKYESATRVVIGPRTEPVNINLHIIIYRDSRRTARQYHTGTYNTIYVVTSMIFSTFCTTLHGID